MTNALNPRSLRMLGEMGVDVWRMRRPTVAMAVEAEDQVPARPDDVRAAPVDAAREAAPASARVGFPSAPSKPAAPAESGTDLAPFTVLCLSKAGAVLLIEPGDPRAARRFAADLLAAATGIWGGEVRQLVFEWPQPGIERSARAASKALGAFVAKQLADNDGALVLMGAEVAARLAPERLPADRIELPPFDTLMTDADRKRALWQNIGQRPHR